MKNIWIFMAFLSVTCVQLANAQAVTLVTLGDSLTIGDGDETGQGGFPARVLALLQPSYPGSTLNNLAVSGLTAIDVINIELSPAVSALNAAPAGNRKIAFVWVGSNDLFGLYNSVCDEYYPGNYPGCEQDDIGLYQSRLATILNDLKNTGAELYIALLDDQALRPIMADAGMRLQIYSNITTEEVTRMSAQVTRYNEVIRSVAADHGAVTVDFYNTTLFSDPATLSNDGNHPNAAGYDLIAGRWFAALNNGSAPPPPPPSAPVADIQANGNNGPLTLAAGTPLRITVNLQSGGFAGMPADWWAVRYSPTSDWAYFNLGGEWLSGLNNTYQGPLFDLPSFLLLDTSALPADSYQFYFGVDTVANGLLDLDSAYYDSVSVTISPAASPSRLQATDFQYLGAFRLPGDETPPQTFAYGGNAMTFNPDGDGTNSDAFPGSLFVIGHDRMAYGGLPDGNQIAEVSIPVPTIATDISQLPQAEFLQNFHTPLAGHFTDMEEIPKVGMAYLNHPATGPKLHLTWGQHLQPDDAASHAWINTDLANPDFQGAWFIGQQNLYSVNAYMFEIPATWADTYAQGRYLATGRMRDGGQGGMGPALFAYRPWLADGSAPVAGTHLTETPLLLYENTYNSAEIVHAMNGYQHPDEWEGGAWITTTSGKSALLFAGTKSNGSKYWYGYRNPRGPDYPCVDAHVTDFTTCRTASGAACPAEDFAGCCDETQGTCISNRGWWSTRYDAQFILYDLADLAEVAAGHLASWQPQPYASLDIDPHLYLNPPQWDVINIGSGDQRRLRVGDVAYDRARNLLYVLEQLADGGKPVVHVWKVW